ncbi:unnamed protein product [Ambrosiozyma monospora]|uniref:Unnamed protein product n=1 Tax=Ambrosiozyma monospora TaxID=43982 RepID=A0ACB5SZH0_AMBMO|nr:unnamed protein product [Ambrosiozyma monospora]
MELFHYRTVAILDVFQFTNCYAPTSEIGNFISDPDMAAECQSYVITPEGTFGDLPMRHKRPSGSTSELEETGTSPSKHPNAQNINNLGMSVQSESPQNSFSLNNNSQITNSMTTSKKTKILPLPSKAALFNLYVKLSQNLTVKQWISDNLKELKHIDVRRFIIFGLLRGLIYRVRSYPICIKSENGVPLLASSTKDSKTSPAKSFNQKVKSENALSGKLKDLSLGSSSTKNLKTAPEKALNQNLKNIISSSPVAASNTRKSKKTPGGEGAAANGNKTSQKENEDTFEEYKKSQLAARQRQKDQEVLAKFLEEDWDFDKICTEMFKSRREIVDLLEGMDIKWTMRHTSGGPAGARNTSRRSSSVATRPASRSRSRPGSSLSSRRDMNKTTTTTNSDARKTRKKTSSALNNESIQVVVRCRGRNEAEVKQKVPVIVKPVENSSKKQICIETSSPHDFHTLSSISTTTKTYTVDQVFGPESEQTEIFEKAALPLFNDFVKGYNCTMLAYGQTGSGKTYTMCGDVDFENNADIPSDAGVIPRVLCELFERVDKDTAHVNCSFVEVYNEELSDLLAEPKLHSKKLRIYDDKIPAAGGQTLTSIKINGLSEIEVKSAQEGLALLQKGTHQRKTASTNMNTRSSRSHSIFIISLMKKEKNGEYTFSRMNLVDLAGSEDIIRSGATDQRAKEAGSINQSLLTLGKVINSLVDGSSHIPYRDSKLTHLLRDSLGGNTKTILVANVSSTLLDLQTTTSTLEYASKAKNVQNSAQIGPLISEGNIVSRLIEENNRLKKDLKANKLKDGVYLDEENYNKLMKIS